MPPQEIVRLFQRRIRAVLVALAVVVVVGVLGLVATGAGSIWAFSLGAFLAVAGSIFLTRLNRAASSFCDAHLQGAELFVRTEQTLSRQISHLEEALGSIQREGINEQNALKDQIRTGVRELERLGRSRADLESQLETLRSEHGHLKTEWQGLRNQLSDCQSRRQILESRNSELDARLAKLGEEHVQGSDRLRHSELETRKLTETVDSLRRESEVLRAHGLRLRQELDAVTIQLSNQAIARDRLDLELESTKRLADGAEQRMRELEVDRPANEELASLRRTMDEMLLKERASGRERDALMERCRMLESEITDLQADLGRSHVRQTAAEQLIKELHSVSSRSLAEDKCRVAEHFVWKLNYFRDNEVVLNFENHGVPVDLMDVLSVPVVDADIAGARRVERHAESSIRLRTTRRLPEEILVRVRYAVFSQEASFRLRPFDGSAKIERLYPDDLNNVPQ
jgi:cell division protein FtsB